MEAFQTDSQTTHQCARIDNLSVKRCSIKINLIFFKTQSLFTVNTCLNRDVLMSNMRSNIGVKPSFGTP